MHPRAGPVAGVALDVQLAAAHARAGVHPHVARDGEPPRGHARADALHAAEVALEAHVVAGPGHGEELADARALVRRATAAAPRSHVRPAPASRSGRQRVGSSGTAGCSRSVSVSVMAIELAQVDVVRAEVAAVVAGGDVAGARLRRRP